MIKEFIKKGFILKANGFYKNALEYFYKALELDDMSYELIFEIADTYYLMNEEERTLNYLEQILQKNPMHVKSLELLKTIFVNKKSWAEAEQAAKNIYCINKNIRSLIDIFKFLNEQNKFNEVIDFYIETSNPDILYEKAVAYYLSENYEMAIDYINKSIEQKQSNKYLLLKGKILFVQNKKEDCVEITNMMDLKDENPEVLNFVGLIKRYQQEYDLAIKFFLKAIKNNSNNPEYYYNCASTYFKIGNNVFAKKYYNLAISLAPENRNYHFALANLYYSDKQYKRALEELNFDFFEANLLKSIIFYDLGYVTIAKTELEKLQQIQPDNELIKDYLLKIRTNLAIV